MMDLMDDDQSPHFFFRLINLYEAYHVFFVFLYTWYMYCGKYFWYFYSFVTAVMLLLTAVHRVSWGNGK